MTARRIGKDTYAVPSRSNPGTDQVVKLVGGVMSCTCAWSMWRASDCHHIKETRALLIVESLEAKSETDAKRRELGLFLLTGGKMGSMA